MKKKKGRLNSSLQIIIPAGLCSLFSPFRCCPRPAAVTSHYVLSPVTTRGREHPSHSGCWLIIAPRNTQLLCPPPPARDLSFCRCTEETLGGVSEGSLVFSGMKKCSKCGARPRNQWAERGSGKVRVWFPEVLKCAEVLLLLSKGRIKDGVYATAPSVP